MEKFYYSVATFKCTWATKHNTKNSNLAMKNTKIVCILVGQWRAVVNTVKSISLPLMVVNFLTSYMPVSISIRNSPPCDNTRLLTTFLIIWYVSIGGFQCLSMSGFNWNTLASFHFKRPLIEVHPSETSMIFIPVNKSVCLSCHCYHLCCLRMLFSSSRTMYTSIQF
jgi:hypothetical protein